MAWITPKTDWYGTVSGGEYTGDYFTYSDFNRIKNNLAELKTMVDSLYNSPSYTWYNLGSDRTYSTYCTLEDFNGICRNLYNLNKVSVSLSIGRTKTYTVDDTLTYQELNRIERACLKLYEGLQTAADGRRKFTWNFGKGMDF